MRPNLPLFSALLLAPLVAPAEPAPDPQRGLYAIWAQDTQAAGLPFLKGGQVHVQWAEVEPVEGRYDFSSLDEQLAAVRKRGWAATVQLNGNRHPAFLFQKVPHTPQKLSKQVGDAAGTLAYWHPTYIQAYTKLIAAYAQHLKQSPQRAAILGVRMNFNALGTEHLEVPQADRDPARWVVPAGVAAGPVWTRASARDYQQRIVNEFIRQFTPEIRVFARNNVFGREEADPAWSRLLETGRLALFHTSSEMEPRPHGGGQYQTFIRYCRSGQTTAYAESWADAWGRHGGMTDPRWCGPEQWNYWRLLLDLHCGVSFIAIYGADLAHAAHPEFRAAFDFAALYAGYHASPGVAPGAWVALREGHTLPGDYSFLMRRLPGDELPPLEKVGPGEQRFGAWARHLRKGGHAGFALDESFACSLAGRAATVQVVYLDKGAGQFTTRCDGREFSAALKDSGRWQTARFTLDKATLQPDASGAHITLTADTDIALHMIEVRR